MIFPFTVSKEPDTERYQNSSKLFNSNKISQVYATTLIHQVFGRLIHGQQC